MIDLHTHILPCMDDGSSGVEESLRMLALEAAQGVTTVALTPHFYRARESATDFLRRRAHAWDTLRGAGSEGWPELILGAEVAWFSHLEAYAPLEALCLGGSPFFLLELPLEPWPLRMLDEVYAVPQRTGLTPILAHVERYFSLQGRARMTDLLSMGLPMQMNADYLCRLTTRRRALALLKSGDWRLSSDCHDAVRRPPNLGEAATRLGASLSPHRVERCLSRPLETGEEESP